MSVHSRYFSDEWVRILALAEEKLFHRRGRQRDGATYQGSSIHRSTPANTSLPTVSERLISLVFDGWLTVDLLDRIFGRKHLAE
jgi:hypothetical protein